MEIFSSILSEWQELAVWLVCFTAAFSLLAKVSACNPEQPIWRSEILTDLCYCFIVPIFTRFVRIMFLATGVYIIFHKESVHTVIGYMQHGFGPLAAMPVWWQAAVIFLVSDVMLYWLHRWFHTMPMWRFHAIHHSSPHVDWLSTFRFHPVNTWLSFTLVDALMVLLGFSPAAIVTMASFNMIYSAMVHANLNWTFGPFKYIFASPVFHRWHHTAQEEGMNKNFAPTFPLLDIVFGTFYMPENTVPKRFGVPGSGIPSGFLGQMIWPFKKRA